MHSKAKHIVIVEDDQEMRSLLSDFLTHDGYLVSSYPSPTEALSEGVNGVDLVISDVIIGKMSGTEFMKEVKKLQPGLPVILISAFGGGNSGIEVECVSNGAFHFLHKPFSFQQFQQIVKDAVQ